MLTVFTPSFADEANTNAQNLTAKEVISRLPSDRFRVVLLGARGILCAEEMVGRNWKNNGDWSWTRTRNFRMGY